MINKFQIMNGTALISVDEESQQPPVSFSELPDDVLFTICRQLDIASLSVLCRVCRKLKDLLSSDHAWLPFDKNFNVLRADNGITLPLKEKFRISCNREKGVYQESLFINFTGRQLPWLQYNNGKLWVSSKNEIHSVDPSAGKKNRRSRDNNRLKLQRDVTKFVVRDQKIVSGCLDGSIHVWDNCGAHTEIKNAHCVDTQAVDSYDSTIVSGSRDATLKVFSVQYDDNSGISGVMEKCCFPVGDRVWSVSLSQCCRFCACGTAFCDGDAPVSIIDLNKSCIVSQLGREHKIGAGVLDMQFEDEHTLLTCGYDTYVRMWDLRTNQCVGSWEQQFDSAYYCLQSDGHRNIFAGTSRHGSVDLWDKRQTKSPVKTFYAGHRNSPVYSLAFNSTSLFVALDVQVKTLNFSCYK